MLTVEFGNPGLAVSDTASHSNRAMSSVDGRWRLLAKILGEAGGVETKPEAFVAYDELRGALAASFVSEFGMKELGGMKVAGDTIGNSPHGLHLRLLLDGQRVVFVRPASERVTRALELWASQSGSGSAKLATIRKELGLPGRPDKKAVPPVPPVSPAGG